jgi:regulatory protein
MPVNQKKAGELSPDFAVAFRKAADYCAMQEHCVSEMRLKLQFWGSGKEETEIIIDRLLKEGFIDEQRYAIAFARGKFRNLHWGKIKITVELKRKKISNVLIEKAVGEIDEGEYQEAVSRLLEKKVREMKADTPENRFRAMRFLAGKGFETELIRKIMNED